MKKLLNIVSGNKVEQINESVMNDCGMMGNNPASPPPLPPVSMSVNLNAQGIDQIKDLISLMNKADSPLAAGPVPTETPPMPMPTVGIDAPLAITKSPEIKNNEPDPLADLLKKAGAPMKPKADETEQEETPKTELGKMADEVQGMADTLADKNAKEDYANEPDEKVADLGQAIPSGDDLHRSKTMYTKAQDGDNPMVTKEGIRAMLDTRYKEIKEGKKSKPDFLDMDKDGNKKEPMKKAIKDKKVDEAKFQASGVRASDKKKGKVDKSERKQYFVKLEKDGKVKGMTIVADEGESESELRDRVKRDSIGWTIASMRAKEEN